MALFGIVKQGQTNKPPAMQVVETALALWKNPPNV